MILRPVVFGALVAAASAQAQETSAPKPAPTTIPEKIAPGAKPVGPAQNLSDKLNQSNGVIHPKNVDPAMNKPAPATGDPSVLRPPATGGGTEAPQAK